MACPLCDEVDSSEARFGPTVYREKAFSYRRCMGCRSIYVSPMPTDEDLDEMYGEEYSKFMSTSLSHSGALGERQVLQVLSTFSEGKILDFGCGSGVLLRKANDIGWISYGVDYERDASRKIRESNGIVFANSLDAIPTEVSFDVIHLGDVLEHLTNLNSEFPAILRRLNPDGVVIAQGPLEANSNLFFFAILLKNLIRRNILTEPPYHVSLATRKGQRAFFDRFSLNEVRFEVFEVSHPAPERIGFSDLFNPLVLTMYLLRQISRAVSMLIPHWGNRYFYVGRLSH